MAVNINTARRIASEVWTNDTPAVEAFARGTRIPDDEAVIRINQETISQLDLNDRDVQRLYIWVLDEKARRRL